MQFNRFIFDNYLSTPKGKMYRFLFKTRMFFAKLMTKNYYKHLILNNVSISFSKNLDLSETIDAIKENSRDELNWRDEITNICDYSVSFFFCFQNFSFHIILLCSFQNSKASAKNSISHCHHYHLN